MSVPPPCATSTALQSTAESACAVLSSQRTGSVLFHNREARIITRHISRSLGKFHRSRTITCTILYSRNREKNVPSPKTVCTSMPRLSSAPERMRHKQKQSALLLLVHTSHGPPVLSVKSKAQNMVLKLPHIRLDFSSLSVKRKRTGLPCNVPLNTTGLLHVQAFSSEKRWRLGWRRSPY